MDTVKSMECSRRAKLEKLLCRYMEGNRVPEGILHNLADICMLLGIMDRGICLLLCEQDRACQRTGAGTAEAALMRRQRKRRIP